MIRPEPAAPAAPPARRGRRSLVWIGLLAAAVGAYVSYGPFRARVAEAARQAAREQTDLRREAALAAGGYDEDGFTRKVAALPGEWLWAHPEQGQTFEEFLGKPPLVVSPDAPQQAFVIQPLTPLRPHAEAIMEPCREYMARFFTRPCVLADSVQLPAEAYLPERQQYDAAKLLSWLAARRPADAVSFTALCDQDLIAPGLDHFVFGLGRFSSGLGCYSFWRFWHPGVEPTLYLRRTLHLLNHEVGHAFGLAHCIHYGCSMNGANSLAEADAQPLHFCPRCLRKLQHCFGFEVVARYRALQTFYADQGLEADAAWVAARLAHLAETGRSTPWDE